MLCVGKVCFQDHTEEFRISTGSEILSLYDESYFYSETHSYTTTRNARHASGDRRMWEGEGVRLGVVRQHTNSKQ